MPVEELPDPFAPEALPYSGTLIPEWPVPQPPKRRRRWPLYLYTISALILATLVWLVVTAPLSRALEPLDDPALLLLSDDGHPIARHGAIKEAPVDVTKLNTLTPAAFVAIEDRRFYRHWGIDPRGIGRALVADVRGGGMRQGGSTITQQLAKTNFLSGDRTIKRKAQEVIIAFWLEAWLTKQEILSRYLSSVYFGDGVYGLRAAAHHYFNRDPKDLTLAQSAMLAGMVQAPSRLAPTHNLAGARKRSKLVLDAMADTGAISRSRADSVRPARPVSRSSSVPTGS
jgi:penicillin-binding protein 1A